MSDNGSRVFKLPRPAGAMFAFVLLAVLAGPMPASAKKSATVHLTGSETFASYLESIREEIESELHLLLEIEVSNSASGYEAASRGGLGLASRPPNGAERTKNLQHWMVTSEALIIGVHFANDVRNLSSDQIADIFSGKVTSWSQFIDGYDYPVRVFGPESTRGTFRYFTQALSINPEWMEKNAKLLPTQRKTLRYISTSPGNIGFVGLNDWKKQKLTYRSYINAISIDGVAPTERNISEGLYPLLQSLYIVTNRQLTDNEKKLVDYLRGRN